MAYQSLAAVRTKATIVLGTTATRLALAWSIALLTTAPSVAQQPGERIAFDNCYNIYTEIGKAVRCDSYVFDFGGSGYLYTVGSHLDPSMSPDGSHLAFIEGSQLAVVNLLTGAGSIVFDNPVTWDGPTWSADGRIAFSSLRGGALELNVMNANGTGLRQITTAVGFVERRRGQRTVGSPTNARSRLATVTFAQSMQTVLLTRG